MSKGPQQEELAQLKARVALLEQHVTDVAPTPFQPKGYYAAYYATTGFVLGIFGGVASLLFNVIGSLMVGQHPLEIIRVYLTFPLGDAALQMDTGLALAFGCCLYLATGMLLGIPFYMALTYWTANASLWKRLLLATVMSLLVWAVNYYAILSWLQPAIVDMSSENLIVNRVPVPVAALTHLVFGWTMVLVYPLGQFADHRRVTE